MKKVIYFASFLMLASCDKPQQKLRNEILEMEKVLFTDSTMIPAREKANELMKLYLAYADHYKDDSTSAEYLFKAGDLANNLHQHEDAIRFFGRVQTFKSFPKAPLALFLQGFIAETELNDLEHAKQYYELFLQQYPNHQLVNDVQSSLNNLGKSPEAMIKEFESNLRMQDSIVLK